MINSVNFKELILSDLADLYNVEFKPCLLCANLL